MPPIDSFFFRRTLISSTIAFVASASRQRTGDASTSAKSASAYESRSGAFTDADLDHVRDDLDAQRAQERLGQRAAGHARGGLARRGALEHVAHVGEPELLHAGEVRMPGPRQVHLGHVGLDRPRVHPLFPVLVVAVGDLERDGTAERPPVPDAGGDLRESFSIFIRPPRPWPSWRRGHVAVDRLLVSSRPAGSPSTIVVRPGPCDSPAVTTFNGTAEIL